MSSSFSCNSEISKWFQLTNSNILIISPEGDADVWNLCDCCTYQKHWTFHLDFSTTYFLENLEALHLPLQVLCQVPFNFFFLHFCLTRLLYCDKCSFLLTPHNRCVKHTHVLVRDCSLFPGSSCKTWVRVRKAVPLSEMGNLHPQTFLAFATVVGKTGKSGSSIPILSVSSFPRTYFLHFKTTIPLF